jgi:hypothetical protein
LGQFVREDRLAELGHSRARCVRLSSHRGGGEQEQARERLKAAQTSIHFEILNCHCRVSYTAQYDQYALERELPARVAADISP